MINTAIIGFGYWGPNLVRNFSAVQACCVKYVCDSRPERLENLKRHYPNILRTASASVIFEDQEVDAVIIATPVFTHFALAKEALLKGKNVLIEKPMTSTSAEALELQEIAEKMNKVLMVDHTFLYTGAVLKMKELIEAGKIGKISYFDSTRINLGLFQPDINVLWDLAPHDLSILDYLVADRPYSVNATGISHTNNGIENIAYLTVNYNTGFIAHFNCSWTSPVKLRMMLIGGDKKMLVFNDLEPTEKIRIYDTGYEHKSDEEKQRILVDYRAGDVHLPKIDSREALFGMASDFINSIQNRSKPVSDFASGLNVIRILEAAQRSIKEHGKEIRLN
jgi:predicted dehydrogenase